MNDLNCGGGDDLLLIVIRLSALYKVSRKSQRNGRVRFSDSALIIMVDEESLYMVVWMFVSCWRRDGEVGEARRVKEVSKGGITHRMRVAQAQIPEACRKS